MRLTTNNRRTRILIPAIGAAIVYGSWALYANWDHGLSSAVKASLTQAAMSFFFTAFISSLIEYLFTLSQRLLFRFLLPVFGASALTSSLLVLAHVMVGTPEIVRTILPSIVIGFIYGVGYTILLIYKSRSSVESLKKVSD